MKEFNEGGKLFGNFGRQWRQKGKEKEERERRKKKEERRKKKARVFATLKAKKKFN